MTLFENVWSNFIKLRCNDVHFSSKFGDQSLLINTYKTNELLFELIERSIQHEIIVTPSPTFKYRPYNNEQMSMIGYVKTHKLTCKKSSTYTNKSKELFQFLNNYINSISNTRSVIFYMPAMIIDINDQNENMHHYMRFVALDHKIKMTR